MPRYTIALVTAAVIGAACNMLTPVKDTRTPGRDACINITIGYCDETNKETADKLTCFDTKLPRCFEE